MRVLLVDDLQAIVDSLKNGVHWETVGVEHLYTACSAKEAKLILMNFNVDVLLCDIEMPEENGLELVTWAKERFPELECIFLTAHAEFDYVKEALHIGSFDYILQPVKFDEVEAVLKRAGKKLQKKQRQEKLADITQRAIDQGSKVLEVMLSRITQGKEADANQVCRDYQYMCSYFFEECVVYQAVITIVRWRKITNMRKPEEMRQMLSSILSTLFEEGTVKIAAASTGEEQFWLMVFADKRSVTIEVWQQKITEFHEFIDKNMDFQIVVFLAEEEAAQDYVSVFHSLSHQEQENQEQHSGIIFRKKEKKRGRRWNPAIEAAISYIEKNLNKNVSRSEVAREVHLSEEYFSRLFRQETGDTFKDYLLMVKMEAAKDILIKTQLSVGIVASKVGYSNFSHFSQMFKNYTGLTPQEFRKNNNLGKNNQ